MCERQPLPESSLRTGHLAEAFLSNLTHELRTPLSVIIGTIPLFSEQILGPLNEKQLGFMRSLSVSAQSLSIMVNDLLVMSELQAGRLQLVLQPVDFPELVGHAIRMLKPLAEANSQVLVNEVPPTLPVFMGDAQKLSKVLTNLIGNAVKFTHGGGTIRVAAESRGASLFVTISDTGLGLSEEEQAMLFQAFGRIHPDRSGGLGLGLAICKAFVEAHGGAIGVESRQGQGSTFWFTLPLIPPAAGAPPPGAG
jgi:signal transduction histidine kinase